MEDAEHFFEIYTESTGKSNFLARLDFNRSISEFGTIKERFVEIMGERISVENLYHTYLDFRRLIGGKKVKDMLSEPNIEDAATLVERIKEIHGIDIIESNQTSDILKKVVAYSKYGVEYPVDLGSLTYEVNFVLEINEDIVQSESKSDIETLYAQYSEQLFNMYTEKYIVKRIFEDLEEFQTAMDDKSNEKHSFARLISASLLSQLSRVYSLDEMLIDSERIKNEMELGLTKRMLYEEKLGILARTDYIKNRATYAKLADSWDESDLDNYEEIKQYAKYLLEMISSGNISKEQKEQMQGLYTKFMAISNLNLTEIVQRREQVKEVMKDGILQYEILVRENLIENVHEVNVADIQEHKIQCITDNQTEEFEFRGTLVSSEAQLGTMLVHFFRKNEYTQRRRFYKEKVLADLKKKRGLRSSYEISEDDSEYLSAMKYYDDVILDNTVVRGFDEFFRNRKLDGTFIEDRQKHSEHICTQTVSIKKMKGVTAGVYGLIFDKNGVDSEGIIMASTTNLESNQGIYDVLREGSEHGTVPISKTSAPIDALRAAEHPRWNNEIDLERNLVKPSGICYFGRNPLRINEKSAFLEVSKMAKKSGLPIVFVDIEALEKEQQAKRGMPTKKSKEI